AMLVAVLVLGAQLARGRDISGFLQVQHKSHCYFSNGTQRVRLLNRYIQNHQQLLHFDSDLGHFVADVPLGELIAESWNTQPGLLEGVWAVVETFCWNNYQVAKSFTLERRGQ
ncbi:SLA class II histocompatibility antigen, DQ haplotype C beta chain, partial [Dryobates pubescens]